MDNSVELRHNNPIESNNAFNGLVMKIKLEFDGIELVLVLEELAKQKNVFGYRSICDSVAKGLNSTVDEIMGNKVHPDFDLFIKARNAVISEVWGW